MHPTPAREASVEEMMLVEGTNMHTFLTRCSEYQRLPLITVAATPWELRGEESQKCSNYSQAWSPEEGPSDI